MAIGRTDEQETPFGAKAIACRIRVWGLFGETHLGQRSYRHRVKGRTHDRTRSERQIKQKTLALQGPSTHAPYCTGAAMPSGKAERVCAPQAAQRQLWARCSVTTRGLGSGRSKTCRAVWSVAIASLKAAPHPAQISGTWSILASGVSVWLSVLPG
jgi:hypothetical protein